MRAAALVDAPLGDGPMTWSSGMHTERDAACEMKNWSKSRCQQNCMVLTKYPHSFWGISNTICYLLCATFFMFFMTSGGNSFSTEAFVDMLSVPLKTWATCCWQKDPVIKSGGISAAHSSVFLVRWVTLRFSRGVRRCDAAKYFQVKTLSMARAQSDNKDRWQGGWWWKEGGGRDSDITGT